MAAIYFNDFAGTTGDLSDSNNWYDDGGNTVPSLRVPNSFDDATLQANASSGTLTCRTLGVTGGANQINGTANVTCAVQMTGLYWYASGALSSPLFVSIQFQVDTGGGTTITSTSCSFSASTSSIIIATSCNFIDTFTFSGTVTLVSGNSMGGNSTFSGTVNSTQDISSGTFSGTVNASGYTFGGTISGSPAIFCSNFTGNHTAGVITLTGSAASGAAQYAPSSYTSGSWSFTNTPNQIKSFTVSFPGGSGSISGSIPIPSHVLSINSAYGINSNLTPTASTGGTTAWGN